VQRNRLNAGIASLNPAVQKSAMNVSILVPLQISSRTWKGIASTSDIPEKRTAILSMLLNCSN
jgi:hypothetical protein